MKNMNKKKKAKIVYLENFMASEKQNTNLFII